MDIEFDDFKGNYYCEECGVLLREQDIKWIDESNGVGEEYYIVHKYTCSLCGYESEV
jgi:rubredoxin